MDRYDPYTDKFIKDATDKNVGTNDTINRQQAIDAVTDELDMIDHVPQWVFDRLEGRLKQLPPAQPEPNYDEWCTDCKEYDHENRCCPRWTKVIRQTRRELQDEFVMTAVDGTLWVTVDDVQKVGRVIVDEDKSKFCRQFYLEEEQRTGHCINKYWHGENTRECSACHVTQSVTVFEGKVMYNYCPYCGAKMEGDSE